jgi:hypothetical protein
MKYFENILKQNRGGEGWFVGDQVSMLGITQKDRAKSNGLNLSSIQIRSYTINYPGKCTNVTSCVKNAYKSTAVVKEMQNSGSADMLLIIQAMLYFRQSYK